MTVDHHEAQQTSPTPGSLAGLRVIEISTSVAAPFGGQILGDLGAEVIKIERPAGDDTRHWTPPAWEGESIAFMSFNRNKKSVVLDYKSDAGRQILVDLLRDADVLVQNLRPGALAKAGFTWEFLHELNPRLIYCEMSGYGHVGPRAQQPAYDPLLQAYSGIVSMTGEDGGEPSRVPVSLLDMGTGMWMAISVFEALRRRDQTGEGCHVQNSLLQTALTWITSPLIGAAAGNPPPRRLGSGFRGIVPYGAFPTADGHIFISAGNDEIFARLLAAIDSEDLEKRDGFATNPERVRRRAEVQRTLAERTSRYTLDEIITRLTAAAVPHSPVNTVDMVYRDEQVQAVGMLQHLPHPQVPDLEVVNLPATFDGQYVPLTRTPPALGQDTVEVLRSIGRDDAQIRALLDSAVVATTATAETTETVETAAAAVTA